MADNEIESLAQRALRRIQRESKFADTSRKPLIHAEALRSAQNKLDGGAVRSRDLHNRINELCVDAGIASYVGAWLVAS